MLLSAHIVITYLIIIVKERHQESQLVRAGKLHN